MNPSRPFILRPVATSLLMVAILLAGLAAYMQLPVSRVAGGGLSDDSGADVLSGGESEVMASSVTAPLSGSSGRCRIEIR